jgi:hypothetical protein
VLKERPVDSDTVELIITLLVFVVAPLVRQIFGRKQEEQEQSPPIEWPEPDGDDGEIGTADAGAPPPYPGPLPVPPPAAPPPSPAAPPQPGAPASRLDPDAETRALLVARFDALASDAARLGRDVRVSGATARFADALEHSVAGRARALRDRVASATGPAPLALFDDLRSLAIVLGQLESFVTQRHNPVLLAALGDADTLAIQCYEPVMQFSLAEGIPLRSHTPVAELGHYDLATWTAFIPTGFAPIFLPRRFFERLAWWPALAHEIAHDFLFAAEGVETGLRAELGLPSEQVGTRPLVFGGDGLSMAELRRVFGGWFEEIFADVFGVLMMGPAYGWSMIELFAMPQDPAQVIAVGIDASGRRYGVHPPRHLRLVIAARVLELVGQEDDARELRRAWSAVHGGATDRILFPLGGRLIGVPIEPMESLALELADRLYEQRFRALANRRLAEIPGVDFGPAQNARCERVAATLLAGSVPRTSDARAVVAGAVLAARRAPEREAALLRLARAAIRAEGTAEASAGAYRAVPRAPAPVEAGGGGIEALRDAILLDAILSPSPAMRRAGLGPRRRRFLERP